MIVEELMLLRIKVEADFWDNPFKVGDIIQFTVKRKYYVNEFESDEMAEDWYTDFLESDEGSTTYALRGFTPFPHLFRPLAWWEERDVKDMPGYVKNKIGVHFKIQINKEIDIDSKVYMADKSPDGLRYLVDLKDCFPITEQEYLNYIQQIERPKP